MVDEQIGMNGNLFVTLSQNNITHYLAMYLAVQYIWLHTVASYVCKNHPVHNIGMNLGNQVRILHENVYALKHLVYSDLT